MWGAHVWDMHALVFPCRQARGETHGEGLGVGRGTEGSIVQLFTCQGPEWGRVGLSTPYLFQSSLGTDALWLRQHGKWSDDIVYGTSPARLKPQHKRPGRNV